MKSLRIVIVSATLLTLAGCSSWLYAEFEEPQFCTTVGGIAIPAVPVSIPDAGFVQDVDLGLDLSKYTGNPDIQVDVALLSLKLTITDGGVSDFGWVDNATLTITPAGQDAGVNDYMLSYTKDPAATPSPDLVVQGDPTKSLITYLASTTSAGDGGATSSGFRMDAEFVGSPPNSDWEVAITPCASAKGHVNYLNVILNPDSGF